jgi:hypothetical protein
MTGNSALDIGENPAQLSFWVDDVGLTIRKGAKAWNAQGGTVLFAYQPSPVTEKNEIELFFGAELSILFHRIYRDTDDLCIEFSIVFQIFLKRSARYIEGQSQQAEYI